MVYAVIKNNVVENILVADAAQKSELEQALSAILVNAESDHLNIGDTWSGSLEASN